MSTVKIAAADSSLLSKKEADIICDGTNDLTIIARAVLDPGATIVPAIGTYNMNAGVASDGTRYIRPAAGVTIRAEPGAVFRAEKAVCRIALDRENVKITGLTFQGWIGIQASVSNITLDGVSITQSLIDSQHLNFAGVGGCTSAIQFWGDPKGVMRNITLKNILVKDSYHHGIGFHLNGADEGGKPKFDQNSLGFRTMGTFENVLIENFDLLNCGSGYIKGGVEDWSCAFDNDTGNVRNFIIRNGRIRDSWQTGIHFDGSWDGHSQESRDLLVENVEIYSAGQRSQDTPKERYQSGIYCQNGTFRNIRTYNCYNCGMLIGNEDYGGIVVEGFYDTASTVGMALEYGGNGAKIQATLSDNLKRSFIGVGNSAIVDLTLINPPPMPVRVGEMTKRIYAEAPQHAGDLARYLSASYDMSGSKYTIHTDLSLAKVSSCPGQSKGPQITIVITPAGGSVPPARVSDPIQVQEEAGVPAPATPLPDTVEGAGTSFTITPKQAKVGDQVKFSIRAAPGKTIRYALWSFDAPDHLDTWNSRDGCPSFFYPQVGTYSPRVTVEYTDGTSETVKQTGGITIS